MIRLIYLIKLLFSRQTRVKMTVGEFAASNPDLLVIVCDPKTDLMQLSYKGKIVADRVVSQEGRKLGVIRKVLNHSLYKKNIDSFIVRLVSQLRYVSKNIAADQFFMWVGSKLEDFAKVLRYEKLGKEVSKVEQKQIT